MSFRFSPPISLTNQSVHLAYPSLKMSPVSVHFSPFLELSLWYKYHNFIWKFLTRSSPCLEAQTPQTGTEESPQFGLIPGGDGNAITRLDSSLIPPPLLTLSSFLQILRKSPPKLLVYSNTTKLSRGNLTPMYITMLSQKILAHSVSSFFYLKHLY